MKILNVFYNMDPVSGGGAAERTFQMSRYLVRTGAECVVLTTDVGMTPERQEALAGVEVVALPYFNRRFYIPRFSSLRRMKNLVESVDVIHLMGHWTAINVLTYLFARRLGTPYVVCPAGSLLIFGRSKWLKRLFRWLIGARIVREAEGHIAISPNEIPQFGTYGVEADRVTVIPNGIDPEDFVSKDASGFRDRYDLGDRPIVLFVGRLSPEKGPDLLLDAFWRAGGERVDDYLLVFAGPDGGMLSKLRATAERRGLKDRVRFLGFVGGAAKSDAYHAADLLVIPSRREAMSIVVLEAGAAGTPVLLTDQCGFDEVAEIGGGRVVPASAEGLEEGLTAILDNPEELGEMGDRLRRFTEAGFTWDSIADRHLDLYASILGTRKPGKGQAGG